MSGEVDRRKPIDQFEIVNVIILYTWSFSFRDYLAGRLLHRDPLVVLVQCLLHVHLERPLALALGACSRFDFL